MTESTTGLNAGKYWIMAYDGPIEVYAEPNEYQEPEENFLWVESYGMIYELDLDIFRTKTEVINYYASYYLKEAEQFCKMARELLEEL